MDKEDLDELLYCIEIKFTCLERKIMNRLDELERKIDGEIKTECKKMGEHIEFVESIYDTVKQPFHFLMNKVNSVSNATFGLLRDNNNEDIHIQNELNQVSNRSSSFSITDTIDPIE